MALIIPEIMADAINDQLRVKLRLGSLAYDASNEVGEIKQSGDTVHFPLINRLNDAEILEDGVEVTPERVAMTDCKSEIRELGKSARVLDKEEIQVKGGVMDKIVVQLAEVMAKRVDSDLADAVKADAVYKVATASAEDITVTEFQSALATFGDQLDSETFAGFVVNSRLLPSLLNWDAFVSKSLTHTADGNGIVRNGEVGEIMGIPVYISNNGTYDDTLNECVSILLKRDALAYVFQKDITVEEERMAKLRATDIVTTALYATKLVDTKGACILRKTIA